MLRRTLLKVSENAWLRKNATSSHFLRRSVRRFLAGECLEEALGASGDLAKSGIKTVAWAASEGLKPEDLEFQMLYGIQRTLQLQLAKEGYGCRVLISYGNFWFPWFMRRLAERPANILFLARNLFTP